MPTSPRRRWFQFSLRTLIAAMFLLSVLCATVAWWVHSARRQMEIVNALDGYGVGVFYSEGSTPAWLVSRLGIDYFEHVELAMDEGPAHSSTPEVARLLSELPRLEGVRLSKRSFTENDLQTLSRRRELQSISLFGVKYLDQDALRHLVGLTQLRELQIQTVGLTPLHQLKIPLRAEQAPEISPRDIEAISQLPNLVQLSLHNTKITDRTMTLICGMKGLEMLSLHQCSRPITDQDAQRLSELKNLTELFVSPSEISDAEVARLRSAVPNCRILLSKNVGENAVEYLPLNDTVYKHATAHAARGGGYLTIRSALE